MDTSASGGIYLIIRNPSKYHAFVVGRWQQRFHANTGWVQDETATRDVMASAPRILREEWNGYFERIRQ